MPEKKKKIKHARDAIVTPAHIQIAQQTMVRSCLDETMKKVHSVEPNLAHFIMAASKDISACVMFECDMPRPVAMHLCERISALALSIYGAYNLAIYENYKDLFKGTAVAALDENPEPPFPSPPAPPLGGEEGGPCGVI